MFLEKNNLLEIHFKNGHVFQFMDKLLPEHDISSHEHYFLTDFDAKNNLAFVVQRPYEGATEYMLDGINGAKLAGTTSIHPSKKLATVPLKYVNTGFFTEDYIGFCLLRRSQTGWDTTYSTNKFSTRSLFWLTDSTAIINLTDKQPNESTYTRALIQVGGLSKYLSD